MGVAGSVALPRLRWPGGWQPSGWWRSCANGSRTPSPPTFQESIAIEQPRTDRFVSGFCVIGQNSYDSEPIEWIRSQRRQSPAGSARKLVADPLAACRSVDGRGGPPEWSCGSGGNGRTPSDKRASIKRPRSVRRPWSYEDQLPGRGHRRLDSSRRVIRSEGHAHHPNGQCPILRPACGAEPLQSRLRESGHSLLLANSEGTSRGC